MSRLFAPPGRSGLFFSLLLLGLWLPLAGCGGDDDDVAVAAEDEEVLYRLGEPITDDAIAAVVVTDGGEEFVLPTLTFRAQYDAFLEQMPQVAGNVDQEREVRRSIVESFVLSNLIRVEAETRGLTPPAMDVDTQLNQFKAARFGSPEEFEQFLATEGLTEDSLRGFIVDQLVQQRLAQSYAEGAADPTATEITDFQAEQAQEVRAQHILISTAEEPDAAARATAEAVLDSLNRGLAEFAELAQTYSDDPGSAAQGGDLGWFNRAMMVPPFADAVYALEDSGDVTTEPVKTRFGYHIIRLTGRREGTPPDTSVARQMLLQQRQQDAVEAGINALRTSAVVRVNPSVVDADLNERMEE